MEIYIWENGKMDRCKVLVILYGNQIIKNILENIKEIKRMDLE